MRWHAAAGASFIGSVGGVGTEAVMSIQKPGRKRWRRIKRLYSAGKNISGF